MNEDKRLYFVADDTLVITNGTGERTMYKAVEPKRPGYLLKAKTVPRIGFGPNREL